MATSGQSLESRSLPLKPGATTPLQILGVWMSTGVKRLHQPAIGKDAHPLLAIKAIRGRAGR